MVDTGDLKSPPLIAGAGSTPVPSNLSLNQLKSSRMVRWVIHFCFMVHWWSITQLQITPKKIQKYRDFPHPVDFYVIVNTGKIALGI